MAFIMNNNNNCVVVIVFIHDHGFAINRVYYRERDLKIYSIQVAALYNAMAFCSYLFFFFALEILFAAENCIDILKRRKSIEFNKNRNINNKAKSRAKEKMKLLNRSDPSE